MAQRHFRGFWPNYKRARTHPSLNGPRSSHLLTKGPTGSKWRRPITHNYNISNYGFLWLRFMSGFTGRGQRLSLTKVCPQLGLPTQGFERPSERTFFYTLRYVPTSYGAWLTVEWISRCRFPRGRVERGSLKYPSPLGSYRLVSGINNESSKLVCHMRWFSGCIHSFSLYKGSEWRNTPTIP